MLAPCRRILLAVFLEKRLYDSKVGKVRYFVCKINEISDECQVHNGSYRIFLEIDRLIVVNILPYPLIDYPIDKGEKGLGHGVATATLRTWHRLRICLYLPFNVGSHKCMATDIAFKLSFPFRHGIVNVLRAKICFFSIASKLLGVYFHIWTKD